MNVIIIGSGIAGITFAQQYRKLSPDASITLLTRENQGYYSRPMLSRGFSEEEIEDIIILKTFNALQENQICVIPGVEVTQINPVQQSVTIQSKGAPETLNYDHLIIATGSDAFIPPPFQPYKDNFYLLNSLQDLIRLRRFRQAFLDKQEKPEWAVIGGGLIGCEIASDLAVAGDPVTLFHAMERLMERQLTEGDSSLLHEVLNNQGIRIKLNQAVKGFIRQSGKVSVQVENGSDDAFDGVIVCCGFKPRIQLAEQAGLATGRGILVNQFLQTSDAKIFALGDVAEFPNGKLYAFIRPIRDQAIWLAQYLSGQQNQSWEAPEFMPAAKVHGFEAEHPFSF